MWPIGLAIVAFIGVYTWIQLNYRKDGPAFEPAQAMQDRKTAVAQKNFYDWYSLKTEKANAPIKAAEAAEATSRAYPDVLEKEIPEQLKYYMSSRPVLLPGFVGTDCPATLTPGQALPITIEVPSPLSNHELLKLLAFYKDGDLFILATLFVKTIDDLDETLLQGETVPVTFLVPTDHFAAETINVRFINQDRLAEWQITNLDPSSAIVEEDEPASPAASN